MTTTPAQASYPAHSQAARRWLVTPPLPREHGAWAWLLLPLVAGGAAAGSVNAPLVLLAAGSLAAFVGRAPLEQALRRPAQRRGYLAWAGLYALTALLALSPLLFYYHRWGLVAVGAAGAAVALPALLSRRLRYRWRAQGELLVVAALSLLAPAAYYAATGDFDGETAALWLPPALYSAGSVFYVRMLFEQRRPGTSARGGATLYVAVLWAAIGAGVLLGALPPLVLVAFLPNTAKVALALARRTAIGDVRRTGIAEALHAALFAALLVAAYALG